MNEEPKNVWKKPLSGRRWLSAWLIAVAIIFLLALVVIRGEFNNIPIIPSFVISLIVALVMASSVVGLCIFLCWLCCWKNFRRFLFACACLATLVMLAYAEEDWRVHHKLEKFESEWQAKGEKFDYKSIVPPTVPDDQNFAMAPIWVESIKAVLGPKNSREWFGDNYAENGRTNFVNRLNMPLTLNDDPVKASGMWQKATTTDFKPYQQYYRKLAPTTNAFPVSPQPQTPAQDVLLALSKYDTTIEELRQASQLPYSRFPVDYDKEDKWSILLPHLAALKRCSLLLGLRASAELQNGQSDQALKDIQLSCRLIDSIHTEPFLISQLVRMAMLQVSVIQPVYDGLAQRQWSDTQLAALDSELAKMDYLSDYGLSIRSERDFSFADMEYLRRTRNPRFLDMIGVDGDEHPGWSMLMRLAPDATFYQNELAIARFHTEWYLPIIDVNARTASQEKSRAAEKELNHELKYNTPGNLLEHILMPSLGNMPQKYTFAQESVDFTRIAMALERYRLALGVYPDSLDSLAPHFIDQIPHAITSGDPLHYQKTGDGRFILYSTGWKGTDNGILFKFPKNIPINIPRDSWVWRYPEQ